MTDNLPEQITFKASRTKYIALLTFGLLMSLLGWQLLLSGEDKTGAWFVIIFFGGLGIPVSLVALIARGRLTLDQTGFEQIFMCGKFACAWTDVSEFSPIKIGAGLGSMTFVGFSRYQDEGKLLARFSRRLTGKSTGSLGDTFGQDAQGLADLMNRFRARALSETANNGSKNID